MRTDFLQALRRIRRGDCELQALVPVEDIDTALTK